MLKKSEAIQDLN